jgi:hypothetical protein
LIDRDLDWCDPHIAGKCHQGDAIEPTLESRFKERLMCWRFERSVAEDFERDPHVARCVFGPGLHPLRECI